MIRRRMRMRGGYGVIGCQAGGAGAMEPLSGCRNREAVDIARLTLRIAHDGIHESPVPTPR